MSGANWYENGRPQDTFRCPRALIGELVLFDKALQPLPPGRMFQLS